MIEIRFIKREDIPQIVNINKDASLQNVSEEYLTKFIFEGSYNTIYLVACDDNEVIGYFGLCYADVKSDIAVDVCDIAVVTSRRRQGVAGLLMKRGIEECAKIHASTIFLEVRKSNLPAVSLYKAFGFTKYSERKNYYNNPPEDAILMKLDINSEA